MALRVALRGVSVALRGALGGAKGSRSSLPYAGFRGSMGAP